MRSVCLLLALAVSLCAAAKVEEEEGVLVLTGANFNEVLDSTDFVLVEFYAPWCGHCKSLAPQYAAAAQQLKEEGSEIKLGKVDATEETELAQEYAVKGYPSLKFFKKGRESEYGGGRTAKEIVTWLYKRTGPPAETLSTVEDAKAFTEKDSVVVVGFFEDTTSDKATAYISAADSQDSIYFGLVTDKEVADSLEASFDSVVVFKDFDDLRATFDGEFTAENIVTFVLAEQLPLVTLFSDQTAPKVFGGNQHTHLLAFFKGDSDDYKMVMDGLKEIAAKFKGKVLFVHIDMASEDSARVAEFFNIGADDGPTCRLINLEADMRKFVPEFEGIDMEKLTPWIEDYLDGQLKVHLNSEDIPEDWNKDPVKVLVGKNFHEVVYDDKKDVFIEFYAPWCGHCKQLAPIWEELAEHFKDDENVVIAKMDSTKNEIDDIQVQGFPTLKFIRKGTNKILDYSGGRTLDELIQYVEKMVSGEEPSEEDGGDDDDDDGGGDEDDESWEDMPEEDIEEEEIKKDEL